MIRIGVIGAGPNAASHAKYYADNGRTRLVAVADPDAARARELAGVCGVRAISDFHDFLPDVDAVVISSPNFLPAPHALAAAKAGKHVFCEKPMGVNLAEAVSIANAVTAAGVKSTVGFSVRFGDNIQTLLRLGREGRYGKIISIFSRRIFYMDPKTSVGWRKDHSKSGGLLLEINLHELDWMMWLGGKVDSVYARLLATDSSNPRNNDHMFVLLNFAESGVGIHEGSWLSSTPSFLRGVYGTAGGAQTDEWGAKLMYAPMGQNRSDLPLDSQFDLRAHFLDCIEGKADPVADVHWALQVMRVTEAIFESSRTNGVIKLSSLLT